MLFIILSSITIRDSTAMARAKGAKGAKGVSLTTGKSVGMAGEFREDQFQKVNLLKDI